MKKFAKVNPGDPITADLFNLVADTLEKFSNLQVMQGSGLLMDSGPHGTVLSVALKQDVRALLSGASSPYSWTEVEDTASGATAAFGMRSGTTDAYEINAKSGLAGKVVALTWTAAGDWRFQALKGLNQCNSSTTSILVTVLSSCGAHPAISGASVTVTHTPTSTVVCTGTTDGSGHFSCAISLLGGYSISASKTGFVTGSTTTTITSSRCGTTTTLGSILLVPNVGTIHVDVSGCNSIVLPGATVTVTNGAYSNSGTSDGSGVVVFTDAPTSGTTTVTTSMSRFNSDVQTTGALACFTRTITAALGPASGYYCFNPCAIPLPATLNLTDSRYGAITLTWNAINSRWEGSQTVAFAGDGTCPAATVTVFYYFGNISHTLQLWWNMSPAPAPTQACPDDAAPIGQSTNSPFGTSLSCPLSFTYVATMRSIDIISRGVHLAGDTFTITE
jgi:hypothetical protein